MAIKKAQSGLEYMVTYGWAVFIMIIVLAILWSMGTFNGISFLGSGRSAGAFASFSLQDFKVNTTEAYFIFFNSVGRSVLVNTVTVGKADQIADTSCNNGLPLLVGPNGNLTIRCNGVPQGVQAVPNKEYLYDVKITFIDQVSNREHVDIGYIKGRLEN